MKKLGWFLLQRRNTAGVGGNAQWESKISGNRRKRKSEGERPVEKFKTNTTNGGRGGKERKKRVTGGIGEKREGVGRPNMVHSRDRARYRKHDGFLTFVNKPPGNKEAPKRRERSRKGENHEF